MIFVLSATAAMAALTWLLGWWGVLAVALVLGVAFRRERGVAWRTGAAAALAWGGLLAVDAAAGPFGAVARTLGGVVGVPGIAALALTLAFPAALAWSAATLAAAAGRAAAASGRPADQR